MTVATTLGAVRGSSDGSVNSFLGIPFAADTSGENRWRSPQSREPWDGVRNATIPGPQCAQGLMGAGAVGSEDCLVVNAFAPAAAAVSPPPSYLFIHGGAMFAGNAWEGGLFDGSLLVRNESVCVFAAQYRLGALGFMVSDKHGIGGNFGLQDQRLAMQWVRDNAVAFGCDGSRLTIGGESAGAQSVTAHLASPLSKGLFQRAISESNLGGMLYRNATDASVFGNAVVRRASCKRAADVLACMRALTKEDVAVAVGAAETDLRTLFSDVSRVWGHLMTIVYFWSPTTDTPDLPLPVQEAFARGSVAGVPLLTGTNEDEGDAFVPIVPFFDTLTGWEYKLFLRALFPDRATRKAVLQRPDYLAPARGTDATRVFSRLLTHYFFRCADLHLANANAALAETWTYRFMHPASPTAAKALGLPDICGASSTCHGAELPFVFGRMPPGAPALSADEQGMAREMVAYWGAFIRGEALEGWEPSARRSMWLGDGNRRMLDQPEECVFWDEVGYGAHPALPPRSPITV